MLSEILCAHKLGVTFKIAKESLSNILQQVATGARRLVLTNLENVSGHYQPRHVFVDINIQIVFQFASVLLQQHGISRNNEAHKQQKP